METTNVMRLLTAKKIDFTPHGYDNGITDGMLVAQALGQNPDRVFKTLVTIASSKENLVFVVPVNCSLDLKKGAAAAGVKSIAMIKQKELLPLTGYIHGGCSPIGMKKPFRTFIEESATLYETICVSAGRVGYQIEINPSVLAQETGATFADIAG
ncbi:MAG: Cys-tRNA(Pro) deacylase [Bacteroidales bacterium]|nr:Cys-tRNA(Pro) deacylase [Bacteroidales bacterium]